MTNHINQTTNNENSHDYSELSTKFDTITNKIQYESPTLRPLICYALDSEFLDDALWEFAQTPAHFNSIIDTHPYITLILWVRFYFEKGNGHNVWECLSPLIEDKQKKRLQEIIKNSEWSNSESENRKYNGWIHTQCWVIAAKEAGSKSNLIYNNNRLCCYLTEENITLSQYVEKEWSPTELREEKNTYIRIIAKDYPEQVISSLKSLTQQKITQKEATKSDWLKPIQKNSLQNIHKIKADWYLHDHDIYLKFSEGTKRKITLGETTFLISNNRLSLEELLKKIAETTINTGIVYSPGCRFPSLDLSTPQLFIKGHDDDPMLVKTHSEASIKKAQKTIYVYLPHDYSENSYALTLETSEQELEFICNCARGKMYKNKQDLPITQGCLTLIDRNSPEESLYCFAKTFGVFPEITLNKKLLINKVESPDADFCLIGASAEFLLENSPPKLHKLTWELINPEGKITPTTTNIRNNNPNFKFGGYKLNGLYTLSCKNDTGELIDTKTIIYISDYSFIKIPCIKPSEEEGYQSCQVTLYGKNLRIDLPQQEGEGTWQWKKDDNLSETGPSSDDDTPEKLLKNHWRLYLNIAYKDANGKLQPDLKHLCFNTYPLCTIVDNAQEMVTNNDDFINYCFSRPDWAKPLYQFFSYEESVEVTYNEKLLFRYKNIPDPLLINIL